MSTSIIMGLWQAPPITTGVSTGGIVGMVRPTKTINRRGLREALDARTTGIQPVDLQSDNIPKSTLSVLVDAFSQTVQPEMGREESSVVLLTGRIDVGLQGSNRISVVGVLDSMKEDAAASAIGIVVMHFTLQPKEQEIGLRKMEDIFAICPLWHLDSHDRIEPRNVELKDTP